MMLIPQELDGFDVADAVARMLDRPELWWQAVGLFVVHFADWENRWQESIGDLPGERRLVHAIRSAATNLGAIRLADSAEIMERALNRKLAGQAVPAIPDGARNELQTVFRRTMAVAATAWFQATGDLPDVG